jgi:hypothetical protein
MQQSRMGQLHYTRIRKMTNAPKARSTHYDRADYDAFRRSPIVASETRFDSIDDASVFFARELDYIKAQTYDVLYPEFTAQKLFPQSSEIDPGAETMTYYTYDKTGFAKIIHNYATDLPRVDVYGKPTTVPIKSIGGSYGYSVQEMRASRYAGKSLDVKRGDAAKYAIDRKLNEVAWFGDDGAGIIGVLSPSNDIPIYTVATNGANTSTKFKDKTDIEILADFTAIQSFTLTLTKGVERPNVYALATEPYLHLATTPRSGQSDKTLLTWILENSPFLDEIVMAPELSGDSGLDSPYAGQDIGFLFTKNPKKLEIENPLPFLQHPVQPKGLEFEVPCEARTAGAIIYYPLSALITLGV